MRAYLLSTTAIQSTLPWLAWANLSDAAKRLAAAPLLVG
jgi:hypothetical protein